MGLLTAFLTAPLAKPLRAPLRRATALIRGAIAAVVTPPTSFLLQETGEFLLLEDGVSFLGLES